MKQLVRLSAWMAFLGLTLTARGAGLYTEEFHADLAGWSTVNVLGNTGAWNWDAGTAQLTFAPTMQAFDSTESSLTADSFSSAGFFSGSYFVAGYPMVGFDFIFETAVPSLLRLDIYGATHYMSRGLLPDQGSVVTQQWYRVMIPLDPDNMQYWTFSSTSNDFEEILDDVREIAITVKRPGPLAETHTARVDNIFLTTIPYAASVGLTDGVPDISWQSLREGSRYRVETAESLLTGWTLHTSFIATNTVEHSVIAAATNTTFFRLQADVIQER